MWSVFSILYQWKWNRNVIFFSSIFKLQQWEWNRVKIHFTIPKLLQVIDPLRYGFIIFHIWTLSTTMKAEMWSVFAIFKIYQQEWNKVKIIFTMRKLLHVIGSCLWWNRDVISFFPYINLIKISGKRCDHWSLPNHVSGFCH